MTIYKKLCNLVFRDLSRDNQLFTVLVSSWSHVLFFAPELDSDTGFLDTSKSFFVDEFSETGFESKHFFTGAAEKELNGVKDVTFTGTVESSDGIELWIKATDDCAVHVSFESFKDDLFDVH